MIDWHDMWVPSGSIWDVMIRGTVMYLSLFILMRMILKRHNWFVGHDRPAIDHAWLMHRKNGMAGEYRSIPEGVTLVVNHYLLELCARLASLSIRMVPEISRTPATAADSHGQLIRENLRRELITIDELRGQLREQGIEHFAEVEKATIESDGRISVVKARQ